MKKQFGSLRELMGIPSHDTDFKTLTDYSAYLKTVNKAKLQELCMNAGLIPSFDRRLMIRALENQFKRESVKNVRVTDKREPLSEERKQNILKALNS